MQACKLAYLGTPTLLQTVPTIMQACKLAHLGTPTLIQKVRLGSLFLYTLQGQLLDQLKIMNITSFCDGQNTFKDWDFFLVKYLVTLFFV